MCANARICSDGGSDTGHGDDKIQIEFLQDGEEVTEVKQGDMLDFDIKLGTGERMFEWNFSLDCF